MFLLYLILLLSLSLFISIHAKYANMLLIIMIVSAFWRHIYVICICFNANTSLYMKTTLVQSHMWKPIIRLDKMVGKNHREWCIPANYVGPSCKQIESSMVGNSIFLANLVRKWANND